MASLQSSFYIVALALCVFSTGILGNKQARAGRPMAFFIGYLGIESLGFAFELLAAHPATPFKALWLALVMISSLFVAPTLWLAMEENFTGRRPCLRTLPAMHGLVIALGAVLCVPLIGVAHGGVGWDSPFVGPRPWHYQWIHEGMIGCIAIFSLQVPYYLKRARRLMLTHFDAATTSTRPQRAWLHLPLLVVGTTWALGMMRVVQCATDAPAEFVVLFAFIDVSVTVGALYLILRRGFFNPVACPVDGDEADPVDADPAHTHANAMAATPDGADIVKYRKSALDAATRARIRDKLTRAFAVDAVHQDSMINLRTLSRGIGEKTHYVSQVINQDLGASFYDLINRHRIETARRLLLEKPDQTVLEIALAVGFNSKSTFNTAFRRHTDRTPSEFRNAG